MVLKTEVLMNQEVPHEGSPVSVAEVSLSNSDHIEETRTATPTTPGTQTFPSAVAAAALNNLTALSQMNMLQMIHRQVGIAGLSPLQSAAGLPNPLRPIPAFTTPGLTSALSQTAAPGATTPTTGVPFTPAGANIGPESNLYSPPLADPQMMQAYAFKYGTAVRMNNSGHRKNATRENTAPLKKWLNEHLRNPYPTKGEKIILAIISHMTLTQVSTWFANARRRLKKENRMTWDRSGEDDVDVDDSNEDIAGPSSAGPSSYTRFSSPDRDNKTRTDNNANTEETESPGRAKERVPSPPVVRPMPPALPSLPPQHELILQLQRRALATQLAAQQQHQQHQSNIQRILESRIKSVQEHQSSLDTNGRQIWKLADMANSTLERESTEHTD